jgi:fructose-1,6-bisphosphatase/inositol monophosphatase family enzyme
MSRNYTPYVGHVETDEVLNLLREVAEEVINPRFRDLAEGDVSEKKPGDLVTVADHEAEALITRALAAAYPDAVLLGEEASVGRPELYDAFRAADHAFTIDPVDGTKNFVHGSPDHAVMVGETRGGEAVRAWIWQPQHHRAYVAERGAGAWRDGVRLTRPALPTRAEWRGVTSRRAMIGESLAPDLRPLELTWISCGIDYPHLVEGDADYVLYGRANPWDHVPGSLLVTEAGGYVGTRDGRTYRGDLDLTLEGPRPQGLVAAADRATYDALLPLL